MAYIHCESNEALGSTLDAFLACDSAALMVCEVDSENNTQ